MDQFCKCPRCGSSALENLQTYSHCVECLYYVDHFYDSEMAYFQARAAESLLDDSEDDAAAEKAEVDGELAS